jgi:predicted transcriptional regulator
MPDTASTDGPPSFEDPFSEDDVEQRIYGTILQTREPTTASAIAERAECDPKTARKYLSWFGELGIVIRHDGHPATYERNNAYFEWRRINQLVATDKGTQ